MKQNVGTADRLIRAFVIAPVALVLAALAGWTAGWAIVALVVAARGASRRGPDRGAPPRPDHRAG
ncbi:MAG TPA: DUF2892 domain-containing protein [Actinomycetes bacterium]|nr:DUF2892 domain-containing protein [Actinomycetes bacterium]